MEQQSNNKSARIRPVSERYLDLDENPLALLIHSDLEESHFGLRLIGEI